MPSTMEYVSNKFCRSMDLINACLIKTWFVCLMSVQMTNGACYLLFEGSKDHIIFTKLDGDPELMIRGKL